MAEHTGKYTQLIARPNYVGTYVLKKIYSNIKHVPSILSR